MKKFSESLYFSGPRRPAARTGDQWCRLFRLRRPMGLKHHASRKSSRHRATHAGLTCAEEQAIPAPRSQADIMFVYDFGLPHCP